MTDFLSPANSRVVRALISGPAEWQSQRALSAATEVAPAQISNLLGRLNFQRVVNVQDRGLTVDRPALRRFFVALRRARLAPSAEIRAEVTPRELHADGESAVLGLFTAANLHAPFEMRNTIDVFVGSGKSREFCKRIEDASGTVTIRVFEDSLDAIEKVTTSEGVATSPVQTILDLEAVPEGDRFAKFLASNFGLRSKLWQST